MKQLLNENDINHRLDKLAAFIEEDCKRLGGGITFICVLNGGFMFFSDLVKRIKYPIKIDFIQCKSYNDMQQQELTIIKDIDSDIRDHSVFIVDDILDSGNTMKHLLTNLGAERHGAKNIFTVTAVHKENVDFPNNYFIYKQPENVNPWYVGYGMDDKGYNRNLNSINAV
jgi:hypoxanthine phosphoribosyltransferase